MNPRRILGGVLLLVMVGGLAWLLPPYLVNREFGAAVQAQAQGSVPSEVVRARIIDAGNRAGIALRSEQIVIEDTPAERRVRVPYTVHRDFLLFAVDLHFEPRASAKR